MKAIGALTILAILAIFANSSYADYHYASHEGSNTYPYTSWATAALLIQDAVNATDPHDTVYIGFGEWYEVVATGVYDSIAIIGMGLDSTFCYTDEYMVTLMFVGGGCLVEGITFEHLNNWKCVRGDVFKGITVTNCRFLNSGFGVEATGTPTSIENCIFDSCSQPAIFCPGWSGDFLIRNNLILNSYGYWAIELNVYSAVVENNIIINPVGSSTKAIHSGAIQGEVIIRNNVVANGDAGIGVDSRYIYNNTVLNFPDNLPNSYGIGSSYDDTLFNNSVSSCYRGIAVRSDIVANYNNLWQNDFDFANNSGYIIDSVGNIYENPMFFGEYDVHLQAYSPLIDAGDPNILDVDRTRSDIGAFGGPHGRSYAYIDFPPSVPDSLSAELSQDTVILGWRYNTEADFNRYQLHRETYSGFEPSVFNLISEPDTSYYEDTDLTPGHNYYYRVAALDNQDNLSDYSEELEVITTGVEGGWGVEMPTITAIESNYPNPFNSQTTIIYAVANLGPLPAQVNIDIYDIMGRRVRNLVDERKGAGKHRIIWDGRNDSGSECPSGVYFARISQWEVDYLDRHHKLVLIR